MLTISKDRLSDADKKRHETILALNETVGSLRRKRMFASFQLFALFIAGVAIFVLSYFLWTGGPERMFANLSQTAIVSAFFVLVFTLLSGRKADRDFQKLQELKAEATRELAAHTAETVSIVLDDDSFVLRQPAPAFLVTPTGKAKSAVIDLNADEALVAMFADASPPGRDISWVRDPDTQAIRFPIQRGLPPARLDRIDLPDTLDREMVKSALGASGDGPTIEINRSIADLRDAISRLST